MKKILLGKVLNSKKITSLLLMVLMIITPFLTCITPVGAAESANHMVINQVFGTGEAGSAKVSHNFLELYNPTDQAINLSGWKIKYTSSNRPVNNGEVVLDTTLPAHTKYFIKGMKDAVSPVLVFTDDDSDCDLYIPEMVLDNKDLCITLYNSQNQVVDGFGRGKDLTVSTEGSFAVASATKHTVFARINGIDTNTAADFTEYNFNSGDGTEILESYVAAGLMSGSGTSVTPPPPEEKAPDSGSAKPEEQWGKFINLMPNNISNTFTGDPKTTRTVSWQTGTGITSGEVLIGNQKYAAVSTLIGAKYHHVAFITGLQPGTTYKYICGREGAYSPEYSFKTEDSDTSEFKILHITDSQIGSGAPKTDAQAWRRNIKAAFTKVPNAAFVVNTGDIVENLIENYIPYYFDYAQELIANHAFVYSMGNNDSIAWYNKYFYKANNSEIPEIYSFDYANVHFINIDSNINISTKLTTWLENDLKSTAKTFKVIMIHEGYYGRSGSSNAVTDLFDKYNVDLVLEGHNHFYCRTKPIDSQGNEKENGTVYSMPNASGTKFNNTAPAQSWYVYNTQPNMPMFSEITFSANNIVLNAYTVDVSGKSELYDSYTFREIVEPEVDQKVENVITLISGLPATITFANKGKIAEARKAYDGLTTEQKVAVTSYYSTLTEAERIIAALEKVKGTIPVISKVTAAGYGKLKVAWRKVNGMSGYEVYRADSKNGSYVKVTTITKSDTISYMDNKRTTGKIYYYKIIAYQNINGKKESSSYSEVKSGNTVLGKAQLSSMKVVAGGKVALIWKKVEGASGYEICRSLRKKGNYKKIVTLGKTKKAYTDGSKHIGGKTYSYKVRAYEKIGKKKVYGAYSKVKSIKVKKAA